MTGKQIAEIRHGVALLVFLSLASVSAEDWPTYMHDYSRSGVTAEKLKLPLRQLWVYRAPAAPKTAWPMPQEGWNESPKLAFDEALYTVCVGDTVYFGSSVDNQVYALDAASGRVRWSFFTGGPVRLAPTVVAGRVYVGSDDGYVYCLNASDGKVLWKQRGKDKEQRVLGRGRMMSLWPIRTGVVVDKGIAYFGAGVFRHGGLTMAAVKAADGTTVWRNDKPSYRRNFSPQGYLLVSTSIVFAPGGRTTPLGFDRSSGQPVVEMQRKGQTKGGPTGVDGLLADGALFVGTQNDLYGLDENTGKVRSKWKDCRQIIITPTTYYLYKGMGPASYGRVKPGRVTEIYALRREKLAKHGRRDGGSKKMKEHLAWRFRRNGLEKMIMAGPAIIAGGNGFVAILDSSTGNKKWETKVDGRALGLTVANGRLLVSTDTGAIYAFGRGVTTRSSQAKSNYLAASRSSVPIARSIIKGSGWKRGFALVVGRHSARMAYALAMQSEMTVHCLEPDAAAAAQARKALSLAGVYGTRVVVDEGDMKTLPYPPYFANVVLIDTAATVPADEALRVLRPYGGMLLAGPLSAGGKMPSSADVTTWKAAGKVTAVRLQSGAKMVKLVRGPLPGAGRWTHQYADAGNTGSSKDERIKGGMDILWLGDPGPDEVPDRHLKGLAPLSLNGLVYYLGFKFKEKRDYVGCFDAYNGTKYWSRDIEDAYRVGASGESGALACTADSVFVAGGKKCYRLNGKTGAIAATYKLPSACSSASKWAYVATSDGVLFGSAATTNKLSDAVFGVDIRTGRHLWLHKGGTIRNNTISVSDGRIMFAELRGKTKSMKDWKKEAEKAKRKGSPAPPKPSQVRTVVALDAKSGKKVWERDVDLANCGGWGGQLMALAKDGVLAFGAASNPYGGKKAPNRRIVALSVKDGTELWQKTVGNTSRMLVIGDMLVAQPWAYNLRTGEQIMHEDRRGRKRPWKMSRPSACGAIAASSQVMFYRAGYTCWFDAETLRKGAFLGPRPGCWINTIPASGVVIELEASSGCNCYYPVQCSVVYVPRNLR